MRRHRVIGAIGSAGTRSDAGSSASSRCKNWPRESWCTLLTSLVARRLATTWGGSLAIIRAGDEVVCKLERARPGSGQRTSTRSTGTLRNYGWQVRSFSERLQRPLVRLHAR